MSIWDGFRNRLGSSEAKEKQASPSPAPAARGGRQDVEWSANLERKLKGVLHHLKVLTKIRKSHLPPPAVAPPAPSADPAAQPQPPAVDPAVEAQSKRVGDAVKEILPALALPSFSYASGRGGSESGGLSTARRYFLDLWHLLMVNLEVLEGKHQKHAYEAISYLLTREEFDLTRMGLHHEQLRCSKDELLVIHRYRVLLFHTQAFVNVKLSDVVERPHTPPYYFSQFCARVLAVTFFRLPGVSRALVQAVALSTRQLSELESYLITLQRPAAARLPIGDHRPASPTLSSSPSPPGPVFSSSPSSSSPASLGLGPSSTPVASFVPVAPPSTARAAPPAVRIGRSASASSEQTAGATASAVTNVAPRLTERRTDSPRIGARKPHESERRGESEGEEEEENAWTRGDAASNGREDERDQASNGKETKKQEEEEEKKKEIAKEKKNEVGNSENGGGGEEGDDGSEEDTGDGRSARKYSFTQGRCYWLVTQLDGGPRTKRKDSVTPGTAAAPPGRSTLASFPNLTTWNVFHAALLTRIPDNEDDKLRFVPTEWLKLFSQRDRLYFLFLRDWVDHILYHTQGRPLEWSGVKGYIPFLLGFIHELRVRKHLTKPLLDCTNAFLVTDPSLLNLFVKLTFTRTKVYDAMAVADALSSMEAWVEQFRADERPLPPSFDHTFLIDSFELILSTEHHQLLLKILMFLYQYSEVFMGDARVALYSDFVLDRHFFYFFLHWDINVRNAFHQLLAYKMLRTKRSQLQGQGLRVKELASVRNGHYGALSPTAHRRNMHTAPPALIDREHALDMLLYEKIEAKLKAAGDQMRGLEQDCYPSAWEVYVPIALTEYKRFMAQYYQWEGSDRKQPKIMPVAMVERTPPPVPVLAQPRPRPSMDGPDM